VDLVTLAAGAAGIGAASLIGLPLARFLAARARSARERRRPNVVEAELPDRDEIPHGPPPPGGEPPWDLVAPPKDYVADHPEAKAPTSVAEVRHLVYEVTHAPQHEYYGPWISLAWIGPAVAPYYEEAYPRTRRARGRLLLVFLSRAYAKTSEAAFRLAVAAAGDKALLVRYRACQLLAESQRKDAIPHLRRLLDHPDPRTVEDASAAIDAIERKQPALFITWPRARPGEPTQSG
jgi:hypothetical protein